MSKIYVIGIGPGAYDQMTGKAIRAMNESDAIIGYTVYVDLVKEYFPGKRVYDYTYEKGSGPLCPCL